MGHIINAKTRTDEQLYTRLHGVELDSDNAIVAVMERANGEAALVPSSEIYLIRHYYEHHTDALNAAQRAEDALLSDTQGIMNDMRIMQHKPARSSGPSAAFPGAAPSFPQTIKDAADQVWQSMTGRLPRGGGMTP